MRDPRLQMTSQEVSDVVADEIFEADLRAGSVAQRRSFAPWLVGAIEAAVVVPSLFSFLFGEVGVLGWGTTVFFVAYCLLVAVGLYVRPRTEIHSADPVRGDWVDRVGAFWLVACVLGPLLGWIATSVLPVTLDSWQGIYLLRLVLAAGLPLVTALALTRYARGKAAWFAIPLLVLVTLMPVLTAVPVSQDLWEGPVVQQPLTGESPTLYLRHTERGLGAVAP